ncbi:MAG: hypothetical protein Q9169_002246 [Polycauliona sp. 2 TL-2023]
MANPKVTPDLQNELDNLQRFADTRISLADNMFLASKIDQFIINGIQRVTKSIRDSVSLGSPVPIDTNNESLVLGKITFLRSTLMSFDFDQGGIMDLMEAAISAIERMYGIRSEIWPECGWCVPIAKYTVGPTIRLYSPPHRYLQLVRHPQDGTLFTLYDKGADLFELDKSFGFQTQNIKHVYWSRSNLTVCISHGAGNQGQEVFIELVAVENALSLIALLKVSYDPQRFTCIGSGEMESLYINRRSTIRGERDPSTPGPNPLKQPRYQQRDAGKLELLRLFEIKGLLTNGKGANGGIEN